FVPVKGGGVTLEDRKAKRTYNVKAVSAGKGEYELEVTDAGAEAELSFKTKTFTVKRGGKVALKAWFERKDAAAAKPAVDDPWVKEVAALPPSQQVDAVRAKLKELNPRWNVKVRDQEAAPAIDNGMVTGLRLNVSNLLDISPVRALTKLETMTCSWPDLE